MKLDPSIEARVRLGEDITCPGCGWPLGTGRLNCSSIVSCFSLGCSVYQSLTAERTLVPVRIVVRKPPFPLIGER